MKNKGKLKRIYIIILSVLLIFLLIIFKNYDNFNVKLKRSINYIVVAIFIIAFIIMVLTSVWWLSLFAFTVALFSFYYILKSLNKKIKVNHEKNI